MQIEVTRDYEIFFTELDYTQQYALKIPRPGSGNLRAWYQMSGCRA
jgi:hypothetical protein